MVFHFVQGLSCVFYSEYIGGLDEMHCAAAHVSSTRVMELWARAF